MGIKKGEKVWIEEKSRQGGREEEAGIQEKRKED